MNMFVDSNLQTYEWGAALGASLLAAAIDVRSGRIPNWLTLSVAAAGMIHAAFAGGLTEFGQAIAACGLLMLPYFMLFSLGRGGAGDAKMMGAIGAWLGIREGVVVLCCVTLAGAVLAVLRVIAHAQRTVIFRNLAVSLYVFMGALAAGRGGWHLLKDNSQSSANEKDGEVTLPYGTAIFLGVCLGAIVVHIWLR
jgi:prepilin peptidase CpaA